MGELSRDNPVKPSAHLNSAPTHVLKFTPAENSKTAGVGRPANSTGEQVVIQLVKRNLLLYLKLSLRTFAAPSLGLRTTYGQASSVSSC